MSNNNLSVLPFYDNIGQQNRKMVGMAVYPLLPPTYILPFPTAKEEHRTEQKFHFGVGLTPRIMIQWLWGIPDKNLTCVMVDVKNSVLPNDLAFKGITMTYAFTKNNKRGIMLNFAIRYNSIVTISECQ